MWRQKKIVSAYISQIIFLPGHVTNAQCFDNKILLSLDLFHTLFYSHYHSLHCVLHTCNMKFIYESTHKNIESVIKWWEKTFIHSDNTKIASGRFLFLVGREQYNRTRGKHCRRLLTIIIQVGVDYFTHTSIPFHFFFSILAHTQTYICAHETIERPAKKILMPIEQLNLFKMTIFSFS